MSLHLNVTSTVVCTQAPTDMTDCHLVPRETDQEQTRNFAFSKACRLSWGLPPGLALGVHLCGITLSRWLFFIEATHVAALYYRGELVVSRP